MTTDDIRHFLLVYDARTKSVEIEDLGVDADAAATRYSEVEAQLGGDPAYEIVLIGADSIETIKRTHAHYFNGDRQFVLGESPLDSARLS